MKNFFTTKRISRAAVIAALYAALSIVLAPISSGEFQCRVSEAFTILPLFFPESIAGLTIGCFLTNVLVGNGALDMVLGTLATLLAAITTYVLGRVIKKRIPRLILGELPPILYNAFLVPVTFLSFLTSAELKEGYFGFAFWVGLGQLAAIGILGTLLYFAVDKLQKKGVSFFLDEKSEKKDLPVWGICLTLGSILPGIAAIVVYMVKEGNNLLSTVLAVTSLLVVVVFTILSLVKNKKQAD